MNWKRCVIAAFVHISKNQVCYAHRNSGATCKGMKSFIMFFEFWSFETNVWYSLQSYLLTHVTLQGSNISPSKGTFEDDFPFPPVAYVGSLEGSLPVIPVDTRYFEYDTVDGSEIRRSRVAVDSLCHYLQGFSTIPGGCLGFLNRGRWLRNDSKRQQAKPAVGPIKLALLELKLCVRYPPWN